MNIDPGVLSVAQQAALKQLIQALNNRIDTAYIFCFAIQRQQALYHHCFATHTGKSCLQADLLVVYEDEERWSRQEVQQLANSLSTADNQYTAIAVHRDEAMQKLTTGDPFICRVFRRGALLYSCGEALPPRQGYVCRETLLQNTRKGWRRWFNTSCQFMDCASYCLMDRNFSLAVFMVHQTIEQACKALLKVMLYRRSNTHNLAWMLKLCGNLIPEIAAIFPRNNPEEKALFNLLKGSYIDCRYAASFEVPEEQAWALYYRASTLLKVAGECCNQRIKAMEAWVQTETQPRTIAESVAGNRNPFSAIRNP